MLAQSPVALHASNISTSKASKPAAPAVVVASIQAWQEEAKTNLLLPAWLRVSYRRLLKLGQSARGRQQIVDTMHLCGTAATALPDQEAVMGLQNDIIGTFQGLAQVRGSHWGML
jgi:hypothetical protein